MTSKEQLYYLINGYKHGEYNTRDFCDNFVEIYSNGLIDDNISEKDTEIIESFCKLSERYTPFDEDLKLDTFFIDEDTFCVMFEELYNCYFV